MQSPSLLTLCTAVLHCAHSFNWLQLFASEYLAAVDLYLVHELPVPVPVHVYQLPADQAETHSVSPVCISVSCWVAFKATLPQTTLEHAV